MITPALVRTLSDYNQWQNASIYVAADTLSPEERAKDRGAFWGSVGRALNHILWGDRLWLSRLHDWEIFKRARQEQDGAIAAWAGSVEQAYLDSSFTYVSAAIGKEFTQNIGLLTVHMFNHQTHHRGQVHAMLTAAGAKPEDTDILFMPGLPLS